MATTNVTPGKWKINKASIGTMKGHAITAERGTCWLAFVYGRNDGSTANARLMAAAPRLRARLRKIANIVTRALRTEASYPGETEDDALRSALKEIRTLAKKPITRRPR